jgi:pilus assembly protein TadC
METLAISIGLGFVVVIGLIIFAFLVYTTILSRAGEDSRHPSGGHVIGRVMALMSIFGLGADPKNTEDGPGYYE